MSIETAPMHDDAQPDSPTATVDSDDIDAHVEVPFDRTDDVWRIDAVMRHRPTGRELRHTFVLDRTREQVTEHVTGRADGQVVLRVERSGAEYYDDRHVLVEALDEPMPFEEYATLVGFDEAGYRLDGGFTEPTYHVEQL